MTAYDITITVERAGSDSGVGSRLLTALEAEGLEAVASHDTSSGKVEIGMTVTAPDLAAAAVAGLAAARMASASAGIAAADFTSLSAAPAHAASPAAA